MSFKEEVNRASPMVDRVNDAIRDNPLAAGLIGVGGAVLLYLILPRTAAPPAQPA